MKQSPAGVHPALSRWLRSYYSVRFVVAAAWVAVAFTLAKGVPALAVGMLVAYPAWDALANLLDARRNAGLLSNPTQMLNVVVSGLTALAVAIVAHLGMHAMVAVFGVWAVLAGLLQLGTGIRRWRSVGAQWAMILSGAQSTLGGAHMLGKATGAAMLGIGDVAPYAAFGAFYFLVSAVWLTVKNKQMRA